jgi:hypothetical protein
MLLPWSFISKEAWYFTEYEIRPMTGYYMMREILIPLGISKTLQGGLLHDGSVLLDQGQLPTISGSGNEFQSQEESAHDIRCVTRPLQFSQSRGDLYVHVSSISSEKRLQKNLGHALDIVCPFAVLCQKINRCCKRVAPRGYQYRVPAGFEFEYPIHNATILLRLDQEAHLTNLDQEQCSLLSMDLA